MNLFCVHVQVLYIYKYIVQLHRPYTNKTWWNPTGMDGWQSPHHCGDNKFWYGSRQSIREVNYYEVFFAKYWDSYTVRNIPKFKDRANWSRDTFQPMRRCACVYQQTNQNIAPVIKNFQNNGRSRTESVIVSRFSGIFLRLSWGIDNFFKWTAYWKGLVKYSAHFVVYSSFIF